MRVGDRASALEAEHNLLRPFGSLDSLELRSCSLPVILLSRPSSLNYRIIPQTTPTLRFSRFIFHPSIRPRKGPSSPFQKPH